MSTQVPQLRGDGVCQDLIPLAAGGGEREEYDGPDVSTMERTRTGLPRYPATGGVSVGSGGPDGAAVTLSPSWRAACLLFWNLGKRFTVQKS